MTESERRLYDALAAQGVRHPTVWRGYDASRRFGWLYREYGRSGTVYLGRTVIEALATIRQKLVREDDHA